MIPILFRHQILPGVIKRHFESIGPSLDIGETGNTGENRKFADFHYNDYFSSLLSPIIRKTDLKSIEMALTDPLVIFLTSGRKYKPEMGLLQVKSLLFRRQILHGD